MKIDLEGMPGRGRLAGKTALVCGGGSVGPGWGNGKAAAVLFAKEGARVVVCDLNADASRETAHIIGESGGDAVALTGDMTNEQEAADVVAQAIAHLGHIDVLHNNIGGSGTGKHLGNITLDDWNSTFARNVTTAMLSCRAVIPHMVSRKSGSIINISSIASIRYLSTPTAVYSAMKGAVNELTRNIAAHYGPSGIRANCVLPGFIDTPFIRRDVGGRPSYENKGFASAEEYTSSQSAYIPARRVGTGWDVAYAALYFASDESCYVTGQMLVVDGGVTSVAPNVP